MTIVRRMGNLLSLDVVSASDTGSRCIGVNLNGKPAQPECGVTRTQTSCSEFTPRRSYPGLNFVASCAEIS